MIINVKKIGYTSETTLGILEISEGDIRIDEQAIMAIDGATGNSGVAILRKRDGALYNVVSLTRESGEEPVRYKIEFKQFLNRVLRANKNIEYVYYEEPIIEYVTAVQNLMMLRSTVKELKIENEPYFNYLGYSEINNLKWKKIFISPDKLPQTSEAQKKAVRGRLLQYLPMLDNISQDEIDAICMGYASLRMIALGYAENELESKKKAKPFSYNVDFIGAEDIDTAIELFFSEKTKVPASVTKNGVMYVEIGGKSSFDKTIYQSMGIEDKLLVIGFSPDKYGDLILKYRLGSLSVMNSMIYAFVWRKARRHT